MEIKKGRAFIRAFHQPFQLEASPHLHAGLLTLCLLRDQSIKDAADRGYRVVCLTDACQAETPERHAAALECFRG